VKNTLLKAQTTVAVQAAALRTRLTDAHEEIKARGDRGDSPVSTVIIVAAIVGALLIAGGLAALYAKANGKLGDIDLG
jgi:hypothetical protein